MENSKSDQKPVVQRINGRLVKGSNLNPLGRKKGSLSMSTKLRLALDHFTKGETMTSADKIVMSLLRQAEVGDLKAIEMVMDRTEGKPVQAVIQRSFNTNDVLPPEKVEKLNKLLE